MLSAYSHVFTQIHNRNGTSLSEKRREERRGEEAGRVKPNPVRSSTTSAPRRQAAEAAQHMQSHIPAGVTSSVDTSVRELVGLGHNHPGGGDARVSSPTRDQLEKNICRSRACEDQQTSMMVLQGVFVPTETITRHEGLTKTIRIIRTVLCFL